MEESEKPAFLDRTRAWVAKRPVASLLLAFAAALVVAAAVAIPVLASKESEISDLEAQVTDTNAELSSTETERDDALAVASAIRGRRDQIIKSAKNRAGNMVGAAQQKVDGLKDQVKQVEDDLASKQAKLDSINASLQQAQQTKDMSTFSDGTWSVGDDILAGTYRSTAGGNCYWEILKSPSGGGINNIIDNGFGPNATITVTTGQWLRVEDCGKWSPGP